MEASLQELYTAIALIRQKIERDYHSTVSDFRSEDVYLAQYPNGTYIMLEPLAAKANLLAALANLEKEK